MVRYILRTVYNSVFRHDDSPGGSCNQSVSGSDRFCRIKTQYSSLCQIGHFVGCNLYNVFGEGSNSAIMSRRLENLIMISEEHWKNDEILSRNVYRHRESVVLRVQVMLITYCFCDFLFHGYPCMTKENVM